MGAFLISASTNRPVVPITIQGIRSKLRAGNWLPRKGKIKIIISEPIFASDSDNEWDTALILKDKARKEILSHCHEPDLEVN